VLALIIKYIKILNGNMNKNLIAVCAPKQAGKDTTVDYLINKKGFTRYAFADPIKRGMREMLGFTDEQLWGSDAQKEAIDDFWGISARRMLQLVGTELFQFDIHKYTQPGQFDVNRSVWVQRFKKEYDEKILANPSLKVAISDMRFMHEAQFIKNMGGIIVKIHRPSIERNDTHASEAEYMRIKEDILIVNDTTLGDFYKKLDEIFGS
jgi:hypothetical protein